MIHLHSLILQLRSLIEKKALDGIYEKSVEIERVCIGLLQEHGKGSDVAVQLETIREAALEIQTLSGGYTTLGRLERLGGNLRPLLGRRYYDPEKSKRFVERMEMSINKIGTILKIEFKETET